MAIVRDEEEQKGQGTSQALAQGVTPGQPQPQQEQQQPAQTSGPAMLGSSAGVKPSAPVKAMPKQQKAGTGTFANLKSYLQAAQGGGQQRVAQAAAQKVESAASGAQKNIQQAQKTFGQRMDAASLANMETAGKEAADIIGAARDVTYQAPQPTAAPKPQDYLDRTGSLNEAGLAKLGDKASTFQEELNAIRNRVKPMDFGPGSANEAAGIQQGKDQEALYEKYGLTQPAQPQAPAQTETQQYISPEDQQRFAEIINAQYQGPQSLQEAGLYEQAARKAQTAERAVNLSRTAAGREQLLKDIFSRGRDYSRGASKLDALLLNASEQGVGQVQQAAEKAGDVRQVLQQAQNLSANEATNRAKAIQDIAIGARTAFTEGRTAEEQATEKRIDDMIKTPAVEKDAQGNVVLDESGQPKKIQKLDAQGKPMVDAEGKPVYMTEWERLPEYFRNVLRTSPETNKKMQEEGIKKLEESTGLSGKRFDELPGQISQIQKKIDDLERIARSSSKRQSNAAKNQIANLNNSLKSLQGEYASYKDFGTQLQGLRDMDMKQLRLSPEEMATLGISSGEGLYNLGQDLFGNVEARRENLITKNELSRQLALAQLAGLDVSKQLQKDLQYTNLEKAGTQDLMSSLDVKGIREKLNAAQKAFKESAESADLVGTGSKKVSRGNWTGTKSKTYYAEQAGNVADMLRQAGYDVSSQEPSQAKSLLTDRELLNRYLGATSTSRDMESQFGAKDVAAGSLDLTQATSDYYKELGDRLGIKGIGAVGQGIQDVRSGVGGFVSGMGDVAGGNVIGDIFRGVGGAIGGINTGEMKRVGESTAKDIAIKDLQRKYQQYLEGQGFANRFAATQNPEVMARAAGLQALLRRQG